MPELKNSKRERFCQEYVKDFNGARAARAAGYTQKRSEQAAYELLTFPEVQVRVEELKAEAWRKLHMSRDEVLGRLSSVARFDARRLFDQEGNLKPICDLDAETAGAVASVEVDEIGTGEAKIGVTRKIKASDRMKALDMLGKYHGVFEADNRQRSEASEKLLELLGQAAAKSGGVGGLIRKR